jgi:hypothetical protein
MAMDSDLNLNPRARHNMYAFTRLKELTNASETHANACPTDVGTTRPFICEATVAGRFTYTTRNCYGLGRACNHC